MCFKILFIRGAKVAKIMSQSPKSGLFVPTIRHRPICCSGKFLARNLFGDTSGQCGARTSEEIRRGVSLGAEVEVNVGTCPSFSNVSWTSKRAIADDIPSEFLPESPFWEHFSLY